MNCVFKKFYNEFNCEKEIEFNKVCEQAVEIVDMVFSESDQIFKNFYSKF